MAQERKSIDYTAVSNDFELEQETPKNRQEPRSSLVYKIIKTVVLVLVWISLGFCVLIVGPTLIDLKHRLNQNFEEISRSMAMRSVGALVVSLFAGILVSMLYDHMDLVVSISLVVLAASTIAIPWFSEPVGFSSMFFIGGVAEVFLNAAGHSLILQMWGTKSSAPVQALHSGAGIGAILAPQLAKPFLGHVVETGDCDWLNSTRESANHLTKMDVTRAGPPAFWLVNTSVIPANSTSNCTTDGEFVDSSIEVCYLIISTLPVVVALLMLGFYVVRPPKGLVTHRLDTKLATVINPRSCGQGNMAFSIQWLVLLFLFYIHVIGGERAMGQFIFSYGVKGELRMTPTEAANLNSANYAGFFAGRITGIFIALKLAPEYILLMDIIGNLVVTLVLAFVGFRDRIVLYIFVAAFGYFESQVYAAGIAFSNQYMTMYPSVFSVTMLSAYVGAFLYQWVTGYVFEYYGPRCMFFVLVGYVACLGLCFLPMNIVARRQGKRDIFMKVVKSDISASEKQRSENEALARNVVDDNL